MQKYLLLITFCFLSGCTGKETDRGAPQLDVDWPVYGGDRGSRQYSPLTQITKDNVTTLELAWSYRSAPGYALPRGSELQVNPLIVDGVLFGLSPEYRAFALDAATGQKRWEFDPSFHLREMADAGGASSFSLLLSHKRGFAYWKDTNTARIFFGVGHLLFCLNAHTGAIVTTFGNEGVVDLREGLGRPVDSLGVAGNTPGVIFENLLIVGTRVGEHEAAAPGHIRAYDVISGEIVWTFRTIPQSDEVNGDTWPRDAWKRFGGANAWAGLSVDPDLGLVFAPLGSPSADFIGVNRHGKNLYGNSLVALDARTGNLRWHYQLVHHDLWDRDLNSAPTFVSVRREKRRIDAVAQTTKQGYVFVFDRATGESLFPIEERSVPASTIPGEQSWPTQPIPVSPPPFARQSFAVNDVTNVSEAARQEVEKQFEQLLPAENFAPLGLAPRIVMPGFDGGATWGGPAFSPESGLLVVNSMDRPAIGQLAQMPGGGDSLGQAVYLSACASCHLINRRGVEDGAPSLLALSERFDEASLQHVIESGQGRMIGIPLPEAAMAPLLTYLLSEPAPDTESKESYRYVFAGYRRFVDPEGYPAIRPPWGTLTAIDLNEGTIRWQVALGEHEELSKRGVPRTGTLNYGGPVVTASELVFIAATMDSKIRAFDLATGREVWSARLPAPAYSTPALYAVQGRQYVVVACGGGKLGSDSSDTYVAFALPDIADGVKRSVSSAFD